MPTFDTDSNFTPRLRYAGFEYLLNEPGTDLDGLAKRIRKQIETGKFAWVSFGSDGRDIDIMIGPGVPVAFIHDKSESPAGEVVVVEDEPQ
jgi:hypothetical protein